MMLNDVKEDGDRIRAGEEASSPSPTFIQKQCLPRGIPMGVQVSGERNRSIRTGDQVVN